ncbi:hypothetical protein [Vreelandella alkaliphila]|uniref:ATP-grasp domain-containing protein n=1 Tax=Vreelandella alkaliphila TaxID=272774 RepID=A0A7C9JS96_9GAMM|nr:hypothetical protein [Halomonas alkaliphila]NDL70384.1 hypothetical protein [Halomonas alkaliphila]
MSYEVLLKAKLNHSRLNSFLIEYEGRMAGLKSVRLSPLLVKLYCEKSGVSAVFRRAAGPGVSKASNIIAMNKLFTKQLWESEGIPNNPYASLSSKEFGKALSFAKQYNWDVVLKPTGGYGGRHVYTDIRDEKELKQYWEMLVDSIKSIKKKQKNILIERKFDAEDYRFFVVGGKVVAVLNRVPANIVGDGIRTIDTLIKDKQAVRSNNPDLFSRPMKVDSIVEHNLAAMGYSFDTVPKSGEKVVLRNNANLSTGGDSIDVTERVPEAVKSIVEKAVSSVPNLSCSAIDVLAKDLFDKYNLGKDNIVMNEIESDPGMCIHHFPVHGQPRNVAAMIILDHFGENVKSKISQRIKSYEYDFDMNSALSEEILSTI